MVAAGAGPRLRSRLWALVRLQLMIVTGGFVIQFLGGLLLFTAVGVLAADATLPRSFLLGTAMAGGLSGVMAERSAMNRLVAALPVSRADVVNSYWATAAIYLLGEVVLGAAVTAISADWWQVAVSALVCGVGVALGIPILLRFGRGLGLIIWIISILAVGAAVGAAVVLMLSVVLIREAVLGSLLGHLLGVALLIGALIGLWALSHRIYRGQDH